MQQWISRQINQSKQLRLKKCLQHFLPSRCLYHFGCSHWSHLDFFPSRKGHIFPLYFCRLSSFRPFIRLHYPFLVLMHSWKRGDRLIIAGYGFLGEGCSVQSAAVLPTLIYIPQVVHCIWESCLLSNTEPLQWAGSFRDFSVISYKSLPWSVLYSTFPLSRHFQFLLLLYCWIWTQDFTAMISYRYFGIRVTERGRIHFPFFTQCNCFPSLLIMKKTGETCQNNQTITKDDTGFEGRDIFILTAKVLLVFKIC